MSRWTMARSPEPAARCRAVPLLTPITFQLPFFSETRDTYVAGLLAGDEQPHRIVRFGTEGQSIHIGARVEQKPRDLDDVFGNRSEGASEPAPIGIRRNVMQQCGAGEIVVRRIEIRASFEEPGFRGDQIAQPLEVARIQRGDRVVKPRMRLQLGKFGKAGMRGLRTVRHGGWSVSTVRIISDHAHRAGLTSL